MKMYKEGITREVEESEVQRFKENGWVGAVVKEEQPKQDKIEVVNRKTVRKRYK